MNELGLKGNMSDEDIMIHVLNNLPEVYDVILDGLVNHLTPSDDNASMIEVIREKLSHR